MPIYSNYFAAIVSRERMFALKEPYPFLHSGKQLIRITILILIIGFLFEYLIIPFQRNPSEHLYSYWIISCFHVGTAALVYFSFFLILSWFVSQDDWKVYKEVISMFFLLFFIGLFEWIIRDLIYDHPNNWQMKILIEEVWHAYLSGSVILFLVITFNFNLQTRKILESAQKIDLIEKGVVTKNRETLELKAAIHADHFQVNPEDILCVKSDGNYCEFYLINERRIEKLIKRISLQSTLEQLSEFDFIVKTHRAYLVNIHHLLKVGGNAAGYQLSVSQLDFKVPVSRAHIPSFDELMR